MFLKNPNSKTLKPLLSISQNPLFNLIHPKPKTLSSTYTQTKNYVNVYMKWKKDPYFDSIEHVHKSMELKPIISLKNAIAQNPNGCFPISDVSKRGLQFDVKIKVARFMRLYPSIFEEFTGPNYNLPWFRLTKDAAEIDREEKRVFEECKYELRERLEKLILMSKDKILPFKIIKGMLWYLGLPEDFLAHKDENFDGFFRIVEMEDGLEGLAVETKERNLSVLQKNAMKKGVYFAENMQPIEFPLFPSKGLRLKAKIKDWLLEFQRVPYISPYEDYTHLDSDSDVAEKRVVGFLHELLCLFVEHSVERKRLLPLKKYFGLPQKVHRAFERHPHIFYLSARNKTRTAILKEAYCGDEMSIEEHPMLRIRQQYIELLKESQKILKKRRVNNRFAEHRNNDLDSDNVEENMRELNLDGDEETMRELELDDDEENIREEESNTG